MEYLVPVVGGLLGAGGIAALLQAKSLSRKTSAEADVTLGGGWKVLYDTAVTEAKADIAKLRERLAVVEAQEQECRLRLTKLEAVNPAVAETVLKGLIERELEKRRAP